MSLREISYRMILVFCVLVSPLSARAGTLVLAFENFPPFEYMRDGQPCGCDVMRIKELCVLAQTDLVLVHRPWVRAIQDAKDGEVDGLFSIARSTRREQYLEYVPTPLAMTESALFVRKEDKAVYRNRKSLVGKRIGVVRGYEYGIDPKHPLSCSLYEYPSLPNALHVLAVGRLDGVLSNRHSAEFRIMELGLQDEICEAFVVAKLPLHLAFSKALGSRASELAHTFDTLLKRYKKLLY